MTKKTTVCENQDFRIIRTDCDAAVCCGTVPFTSYCIKKKGGLQQFNMEEEKLKSLWELLNSQFKNN
jgi:hypothetical protein